MIALQSKGTLAGKHPVQMLFVSHDSGADSNIVWVHRFSFITVVSHFLSYSEIIGCVYRSTEHVACCTGF